MNVPKTTGNILHIPYRKAKPLNDAITHSCGCCRYYSLRGENTGKCRYWETKFGRLPDDQLPTTLPHFFCNKFERRLPFRLLLHQAICRTSSKAEGWQPIETAPKDGSLILLLSAPYTHTMPSYTEPPNAVEETIHQPARINLGKWNPNGDSWVDERGLLGGDCYTLAVTGVWDSGGGWFQPNEVTHWHPLPELPVTASGPVESI